jgi:hypothetical protein
MSADEYFEVCRLVASYKAETSDAQGAMVYQVTEDEQAHAGNKSRHEGYTTQQIAAFKAHITMLRKSLPRLTGEAKAMALQKLARQEARLAAALSRNKKA